MLDKVKCSKLQNECSKQKITRFNNEQNQIIIKQLIVNSFLHHTRIIHFYYLVSWESRDVKFYNIARKLKKKTHYKFWMGRSEIIKS